MGHSKLLNDLIKEASEAEFRCIHCYAVNCACNEEPGEPDAI